jgi:palmitoyl transferase
MNRSVIFFLLLFSAHAALAEEQNSKPNWFKKAQLRWGQIWHEGNNELYVTGYAWHNRYTYPKDRIDSYNERAYGGGLGKGLYDENGNWHGLSAFAFLDSHKNIQPVAGYAFIKMHHFDKKTHAGAGYSILITQRPDIYHGIPFPGALPWVFFGYDKAMLCLTYIPGLKNHPVGNVLFLFAKWTF